MSFKGHTHSEETRRKISVAQIGKKVPQESIEKSRIARLGKKRTVETRLKISEALKGKPKSLIARGRMSAAKKGVRQSPEHIEKDGWLIWAKNVRQKPSLDSA